MILKRGIRDEKEKKLRNTLVKSPGRQAGTSGINGGRCSLLSSPRGLGMRMVQDRAEIKREKKRYEKRISTRGWAKSREELRVDGQRRERGACASGASIPSAHVHAPHVILLRCRIVHALENLKWNKKCFFFFIRRL